nr:sigma-70 family RNA polymerase sigma factor [Micromonospora sp. DSM 115978]
IRAFVARRVADRSDAEDVTQETLLRLYRNVHTLRDAGALEGWMYQIARNAITDHYRRSATRPVPLEPAVVADALPAAEATGAAVDGADTADTPERATAVLASCLEPLLSRVPPTYRQALELTDLGGLTQDVAARQLGLSTSGMKSRVQRGRRLLRAEVRRCCEIAVDSRGAIADVELRSPDGRC